MTIQLIATVRPSLKLACLHGVCHAMQHHGCPSRHNLTTMVHLVPHCLHSPIACSLYCEAPATRVQRCHMLTNMHAGRHKQPPTEVPCSTHYSHSSNTAGVQVTSWCTKQSCVTSPTAPSIITRQTTHLQITVDPTLLELLPLKHALTRSSMYTASTVGRAPA